MESKYSIFDEQITVLGFWLEGGGGSPWRGDFSHLELCDLLHQFFLFYFETGTQEICKGKRLWSFMISFRTANQACAVYYCYLKQVK